MDPLSVRKSKLNSSPNSVLNRDSNVFNGRAIPISKDDMEDAACKSKKKKKKRNFQKRNFDFRWLLTKMFVWWPIVLALLVVSWLILEVCHSSQDHFIHNTLPRRLALGGINASGTGDGRPSKKESNLNNLDMPTRMVGGERKPCLQLISSEEIAELEFPHRSSSPVKVLHYKSFGKVFESLGQQSQNLLGRDLLFTGNQTMEERQQSYKVSETMAVHCGFCSGEPIFVIEIEDRSYLQRCEAVVTTCNFGGGDDIYQPINMTQASLSKVCYVAFWDEVTLEAQEVKGRKPDMNRKIGHWRIVVVKNLPFADQRLNGKIPKMLAHRLFDNAKYSIWVDSKSQFRRDPMGVLEALLWRVNSSFAISEHGARDCLYKEGEAIVRKNKASPEEVAIQLAQYRSEGFPEKFRFDGHKALAEASVIIREHTPITNLFMCLWFNEVTRFTARDQLSFPYVLQQLGVLQIHMFPVCTRKALVNSLGHVKKAKPLGVDDLNEE